MRPCERVTFLESPLLIIALDVVRRTKWKKQMTARMKLAQRQGLWAPHYLAAPSHPFGSFLGAPGFYGAAPPPCPNPAARERSPSPDPSRDDSSTEDK